MTAAEGIARVALAAAVNAAAEEPDALRAVRAGAQAAVESIIHNPETAAALDANTSALNDAPIIILSGSGWTEEAVEAWCRDNPDRYAIHVGTGMGMEGADPDLIASDADALKRVRRAGWSHTSWGVEPEAT